MSRDTRRAVVLFLSTLLANCTTWRSADRAFAGEGLDRAGFIDELVFARATARTPRFDDYTEGSYHVDKLDLLEGVRQRRNGGTPILALFVQGPAGPMWSYEIVLFLRVENGVRANQLSMTHARITVKSTSFLGDEEYRELVQRVSSTLVEGAPAPAENLDWSYDMLFCDFAGTERVFHSEGLDTVGFDVPERKRALWAFLDERLSKAVVTYSTVLPDPSSPD
jgi:hypothetical protein